MKSLICLVLLAGFAWITAGDDAPKSNAQSLFDGKTLTGWKVTEFGGKGTVEVREVNNTPAIVLGMGVMTGITYTNAFPKMNYEVTCEATRVQGSDFFCGMTFPVNDDFCSFIVGGWGGGVVGLSSLNGADASENETTKYLSFKSGQWYKIRVRVTPGKIEAWIDKDQMADVETKDKKVSTRIEVEQSKPFGIATWSTEGAIRNIQVRKL